MIGKGEMEEHLRNNSSEQWLHFGKTLDWKERRFGAERKVGCISATKRKETTVREICDHSNVELSSFRILDNSKKLLSSTSIKASHRTAVLVSRRDSAFALTSLNLLFNKANVRKMERKWKYDLMVQKWEGLTSNVIVGIYFASVCRSEK